MQTAPSKLLLSGLHRRLRRPPKAAQRCLPLIDFCTSNNPTRAMSGGRRRNDCSEELFLRNLNFGGGGPREQGRAHPEAPPYRPSAGRPMRGEQRCVKEPPLRGNDGLRDATDDLFPEFESDELDERGNPEYRDFGRSPLKDFSRGGRREQFDDDRSPVVGDGSENVDRTGDSIEKKMEFQEAGRRKKVEKVDQRPQPTMDESVAQEELPEEADEILREMRQTGLIPNAVAMLDGLCKDGLIQEAMKLFRSMREKGTMPEVVIYTATVEGFCKAAKFDEAKRIFRKMQKKGIEPNAFSYKVLIQALCKGKKLEDSVEFCFEMLAAGHLLSPGTLVTLLDVFCKEKRMEEAEDVVRKLQERGFVLDERAVREHLDKKGPFSPLIWEVIGGKKNTEGHS